MDTNEYEFPSETRSGAVSRRSFVCIRIRSWFN